MGSFTQFLDMKALDHEIGAQTHSPVATLYLALSTTTIAGDGTGITEPPIGTNNYSRVAVTNNNTNFPNATIVAGKAQKKNGVQFDFPQASGSWGTVTDVAIYDAATGGNMLAYAVLTVPKPISAGDTLKFAANSLTFDLG